MLYDEHGGFFDHVPPPSAVPPDQHATEYSFDRLGVRVPALLISPWVDAGVVSTEFDHTSLLKYLIEKWHLEPLTERVSHANSIDEAIRKSGKPREDTIASIPVPSRAIFGAQAPVELDEPANDLQRSLIVFSEHLEQEEMPAEAPVLEAITAAADDESQAKTRINAFLISRSSEPNTH